YFSAAVSPASLADYYRAVADASPVPVLVYNIPKYTHLPIAAGLLRQLAAHANIVGVKDSSGDAKNLASYRDAAPQWSVFVGSGSLLYAALELGCDGGILAVACFAAALSAQVFAAAPLRASAAGRRQPDRCPPSSSRLGVARRALRLEGPAPLHGDAPRGRRAGDARCPRAHRPRGARVARSVARGCTRRGHWR